MLQRLLGALAILAGKAEGDIHGARRIAHEHGYRQTRASSGRIRAALDLAGMPAFNEYRSAEELALGPGEAITLEMGVAYRQARNVAKRRRRALRAGTHRRYVFGIDLAWTDAP